MGLFLSLLLESISSAFYGIVLTAFVMATLFFLLKNLSNGVYRSVPFYITGVVLAILLTVNFTIIIGAFSVKGQTDAMHLWMTQLLNGIDGYANIENSQIIGEKLSDEFPMLGCFFDLYNMSGNTMSELPDAFYETINSELNGIILSRILWSAGFIIAAVLVALYFTKENVATNRRTGGRHRNSIRRNIDDF